MPRFTAPSGAQVDTTDPDRIRRLTVRGWTTEDHEAPVPTPWPGALDDGDIVAEDTTHEESR